MDPFSAIGLTASVLQLADLGAKLSVKLFNVSKQVKNASAHYESVSQEVASTNAVVQQLSALLSEDSSRQLFGPVAIQTTGTSIVACEELFKSLLDDITPKLKADTSSTAKMFAEWKHRLTLPYRQTELTSKQSKLRQLKGTLMLNLNIIVLAAQVSLHDNSIEGKVLLLEQRDAVRSLHHAIEHREQEATIGVSSVPLAPKQDTSDAGLVNLTQMDVQEQKSVVLEKSYSKEEANGKTSTTLAGGFPTADGPEAERGIHVDEATKNTDRKSRPESSSQEHAFKRRALSHEARDDSINAKKTQGPIENDRARFRAHAFLIQEILALIDQYRDLVKRKIETDMYYGALALHHNFWTRVGSEYCFDELVPHIPDCQEVVSQAPSLVVDFS